MNANIDLGWEEWVNLPAINLPYIKAKVDTGAQTSVLHAKHIEVFKVKNKKFVRFEISPLPEKPNFTISCSAPLTGRRKVTSCLLYTSPSPRDRQKSRMPSSA